MLPIVNSVANHFAVSTNRKSQVSAVIDRHFEVVEMSDNVLMSIPLYLHDQIVLLY